MARFVVGCSLLLFTAFQIGCANSCTPKCSGCGELYLGAYVNDPPRCEPCDRCANYTGGCGCDPCADRMPWNRSRGRFFQTLNEYIKRGDSQCCGGDCGCDECCDEGCGAAGCGDAGCGCGTSSGGMSSGGEVIYEDAGQPMSSRATQSNVRTVSRPRVVETVGSRSPQQCNCGRH